MCISEAAAAVAERTARWIYCELLNYKFITSHDFHCLVVDLGWVYKLRRRGLQMYSVKHCFCSGINEMLTVLCVSQILRNVWMKQVMPTFPFPGYCASYSL